MSNPENQKKSNESIPMSQHIQPLIGAWMRSFQEQIRAADEERLAGLMSPGVLGFGHSWIGDRGMVNLQWIDNKEFEFDELQAKMFWSRDWLTTVLTVPWRCGEELGRSTLVLQAYPEKDRLLCLHYHFSREPFEVEFVTE
ncbi:MAG: hypothetical protein HW407_1057 [Bacteroidetes bacterium]|nr:hypothetical protein [Bacteroidota bacterium]